MAQVIAMEEGFDGADRQARGWYGAEGRQHSWTLHCSGEKSSDVWYGAEMDRPGTDWSKHNWSEVLIGEGQHIPMSDEWIAAVKGESDTAVLTRGKIWETATWIVGLIFGLSENLLKCAESRD